MTTEVILRIGNSNILFFVAVAFIIILVFIIKRANRLSSAPVVNQPILYPDNKYEITDLGHNYGIPLKANGGFVNVNNPFRGTLVVGGAGSGKSESIIKPYIAEAAALNYSGILYDFKNPQLSLYYYHFNELYRSQGHKIVNAAYINFQDLQKTQRCNPLAPRYIPSVGHAEEYATVIYTNLIPESIKKMDFWHRSAIAILQASIWYFVTNYPEKSTLPHIVAFLQGSVDDIFTTLKRDSTCKRLISSILTSYENKALGQLSGTIGTLQLALNRFNSPEIAYVLSSDDVNLDLNDPKDPTFLCIGNIPTLQATYSPVISLIITVATKMMNNPNKHHSIVILDEAPTIYIPNLEVIPATGRENKVALVFACQDFSQITDAYGKDKTNTIIANLANQFYGRVSHHETAEYMIKLGGKHDVLMTSYSSSSGQNSSSGAFLSGQGSSGSSSSSSSSSSYQLRDWLTVQQIRDFQQGQFFTILVEREKRVHRKNSRSEYTLSPYQLPPMAIIPFLPSEKTTKESFTQIVTEPINTQYISKSIDSDVSQIIAGMVIGSAITYNGMEQTNTQLMEEQHQHIHEINELHEDNLNHLQEIAELKSDLADKTDSLEQLKDENANKTNEQKEDRGIEPEI